MVYLGRLLGGGLTKSLIQRGCSLVSIPANLYGVSGRSDESKARIAHKYPDRVFIGSSLTKKCYDELTETDKENIKKYLDSSVPYDNVSSLVKELSEKEKGILRNQIRDEEFIFYDGIKIRDNTIVISNGIHTKDIIQSLDLRGTLNKWGPELDGPNKTPQTPRIGYIRRIGMCYDNLELGIVSRLDDVRTFKPIFSPGNVFGLSTYSGNTSSPRDMVINYEPQLLKLPAEGKTAQQLADDLFEWMDRDFVVCTAAAVYDYNKKEWNLAVRNLHKSN